MRELGLDIWYQALSSPIGIVLLVDNVDRARARLYALRRESKDPSLNALSLVPSPDATDQLWIVRNETRKDATPQSNP